MAYFRWQSMQFPRLHPRILTTKTRRALSSKLFVVFVSIRGYPLRVLCAFVVTLTALTTTKRRRDRHRIVSSLDDVPQIPPDVQHRHAAIPMPFPALAGRQIKHSGR